jgi:hypothetical protein
MPSASRQGGRWWTVVAALGVAVAAWSVNPPAVANEPTDVRVVSVTRGDDGAVTIVVSVPMQQVGAASAPGGLTVVGPDGSPMTPVVAALPPSATAVVVLLHTPGADPTSSQRAGGAAAELLRSLDPAVAVAIVSTTGVVVAPLGTDRRASLAALGRPATPAPLAFAAALGAAGTQLAGRSYVDPLAVLIDAGTADPGALPLDALAPAGMSWRIIPIAATASPLVTQFAQRAGVSVPVGRDPIALVDDAVGLVAGRFSLRLPASVAGPLTVHLHGTGGDLTAAVTVPAPAPAPTAAATTIATTATTVVAVSTTPVVLVERPAITALVAPPQPSSDSSSSWWVPVLGGAIAVVAVGGGALLLGRRRSAARLDEPEPTTGPDRGTNGPGTVAPATAPAVATPARYHYTDLSQPLPSGAVRSRPRREIVARVPEPDAGPTPASVSFDRRRRVLTLAKELGNVSEACRIVGVSRRSYYEWKRIADEQGIEALRPKRQVRRSREAGES